MRMEDLRYLIQVAETNSISQAAERCYITQQGLSKIINNLERELNLKLFYRNRNKLSLTPDGEAILSYVKTIEKDYLSMMEQVQLCQNRDLGMSEALFTIYATPVMCITVMPRVLAELSRRFPNLHFNVIEQLPVQIVDEVQFDENNIGVLSISGFLEQESERLNAKESPVFFESVFQDVLMVSVQEHHGLASKPVITIRELAKLPLAVHYTESRMAQHLLGKDYTPNVVLHSTNYTLCQQMIAKGMAVGLSSTLLEQFCPSEHVVMVPIEKSVTLSYGCIYGREQILSNVGETVRDLVNAELKKCGELVPMIRNFE